MSPVWTPPCALEKYLLNQVSMSQSEFEFRTWGGKRVGSGRHPKGEKAGVSHLSRPDLTGRHPVHVTLRLVYGLGYLRAHSRMRAIEGVLREAKERFGLRIIHYSVQGIHLHLIQMGTVLLPRSQV